MMGSEVVGGNNETTVLRSLAAFFRKSKPYFFFLEMNLVTEFQVILFCQAGWEGCLHGSTDGKIYM